MRGSRYPPPRRSGDRQLDLGHEVGVLLDEVATGQPELRLGAELEVDDPDRADRLEPGRAHPSLDSETAQIEWGVGVEPEDLERFLVEDGPAYLDMGFTQFTPRFNGPDWNVEPGLPWLAWRDEQNRAAAATRAPAVSAARR